MKRIALEVTPRKVLGKKVKKLRREGILPANIYGKDVKSLSVQLPTKEFQKVFGEVGETGLVDLKYDSKTTPVLIHNVQTDYLGSLLHADFYVVNLLEKVKTMVPVELTGEPKAVTDKVGLLMHILSEVEVEALPENLPEKIEVNVESLVNVDDQITIGDVKTLEGVTILSDPTQVVAKIGELVTREAQEQAAAEAAAAEAAKAEAGAAVEEEGVPPVAEGEAPGEAPAEAAPAEPSEQPKEEEQKPTEEKKAQ